MTPDQLREFEQLKNEVKKLREVTDVPFVENIYRRLEDRIEEKVELEVALVELNDLADVDTSGVSNGQVIKYNSGTWENANDIDT